MHRRRVFIAAIILAAGCSRARPAAVPAPAPAWPQRFDFVAETVADSAMEGTFEGSATFDGGWLTITVPRATVTVPPGNSENWRNLTVRAFVASDYRPGEWKALAQSRPQNIFRFLDFGSTPWSARRTLPIEKPLSFVVPVPPGATAATSRIAIELEWVFVMGTFGDTDSRIAFSGPIR